MNMRKINRKKKNEGNGDLHTVLKLLKVWVWHLPLKNQTLNAEIFIEVGCGSGRFLGNGI